MIKKCRYKNCTFPDCIIDIDVQPYKADGKKYYHEECFQAAMEEENEAKIVQEIKRVWMENISNTVNVPQLMGVVKKQIAKGVSAEYILFTLNFIIKNKYSINYPAGLCYYFDNKNIKEAYKKSKISYVNLNDFKTTDVDGIKFKPTKQRVGFGRILR